MVHELLNKKLRVAENLRYFWWDEFLNKTLSSTSLHILFQLTPAPYTVNISDFFCGRPQQQGRGPGGRVRCGGPVQQARSKRRHSPASCCRATVARSPLSPPQSHTFKLAKQPSTTVGCDVANQTDLEFAGSAVNAEATAESSWYRQFIYTQTPPSHACYYQFMYTISRITNFFNTADSFAQTRVLTSVSKLSNLKDRS